MTLAISRGALIAVAICAAAGAGRGAPPDRSDAAIVLEIQRLLSLEIAVEDPDRQREAILAKLREVPALVGALEEKFPDSEYRPVAYSLALDALTLRRQAGDETVTCEQMSRAARKLLSVAGNDDLRVKARFVLLEVTAVEVLSAPEAAVHPTTTSSRPAVPTTTSKPAAGARLASLARRFVALADEFPKTIYAPAALFQGGGIFLEARRDDAAVAVYDRLSRDYPKDPFTLKALMILVQLHGQAGRTEQALQAKRAVVERFPGSSAAIKYRADIARVECLGKPFFLRFRSVRGRQVNVRRHKGKTVLVYFYASIVEAELTDRVAGEMSALAKLAAGRGWVLLAVGADRADDAEKVAGILNDRKIDTPNLIDSDTKVARNYGVLFAPAVAVVDAEGKLRDIVSDTDIVAAVRKATAPPASQPAVKSAS